MKKRETLKIQALIKCLDWSIRDLASWLGEPYSTVHNWMHGKIPREPAYSRVQARLSLLRSSSELLKEVRPLRGKMRQSSIRRAYRNAVRANRANAA